MQILVFSVIVGNWVETRNLSKTEVCVLLVGAEFRLKFGLDTINHVFYLIYTNFAISTQFLK